MPTEFFWLVSFWVLPLNSLDYYCLAPIKITLLIMMMMMMPTMIMVWVPAVTVLSSTSRSWPVLAAPSSSDQSPSLVLALGNSRTASSASFASLSSKKETKPSSCRAVNTGFTPTASTLGLSRTLLVLSAERECACSKLTNQVPAAI
ncbi:Uncharacterized protein Rs2_04012 [Raphanus sativus]|nr:Uncharacterized protein Rs2_04012 [Raphanus sativus]